MRSYSRSWPAVFERAVGSWIYDETGRKYLDFFAGAGALNYGHNNPVLKEALLEYLNSDGVTHSLDMFTVAKREFLTAFDEIVLKPRQLDFRVQFPGPGGANSVEAALKLARKITGRSEVIFFANGFHGMSLGALAVTANPFYRGAAGLPLTHGTSVPFDQTLDSQDADFGLLDRLIQTGECAAVIVETVQGEGGINVASGEWLRALAERCRRFDLLLIVDDVQMGCGRTGPFFSFEAAGIMPDIVCLSKSIGGYGLPLALTLIRPDLDVWQPGEHTGTFRGVNPAFVTGTAALRHYWQDEVLEHSTVAKGQRIRGSLHVLAESVGGIGIQVRGQGLANGLAFVDGETSKKVCQAAFEHGLIVETAGLRNQVVKLFPALTIAEEELDLGLNLLADAVREAC